jgi:hypothetical protein
VFIRPILAASLAVLVCAAARAGVVTGRVLVNGVPLSGADLDFDPVSGGGGVTEMNDGTDAQGYFTTTVTPNNLYDMIIVPPPGSNALVTVVPNVVISTTVNNLGTLNVPSGVIFSGRCVDGAGAGVAGVNLDVLDANGNDVLLARDRSDSLGYFSIVVPAGPIEVRFDTTGVVGPLLAPKSIPLDLSANYAAGNVALAPGFVLSGLVRRASNNTAVANVDLDVIDSLSGALLFTPGDKSDAAGFVDVVLPAGTFDLRFEAPFALHLVGVEIDNHVVTGNGTFGTLLLQNAVVLSGTVSGFDGTLHGGVDVDVKWSSTGVGVFLGHDNTDVNGFYQVNVPTGTFDVTFSPPLAIPYGEVSYASVVIAGNTVRNGTLPSCPFYSTVGTGLPGFGGITPVIGASGGAPRLGNLGYQIELTQGRGGAKAIVVFSILPTPNPLPSPCVTVPPMARRVFNLGGTLGAAGAGFGSYPMPLADNPLTAGHLLRAWVYVRDGAAASGVSRTHELRATLCP